MIQFLYRDFLLPDGKTIVARPMIECFMMNGKRGLLLTGILDSGSDSILISKDVAEFLGFHSDELPMREVMGIGGTIQTVSTKAKIVLTDGGKRYVIDDLPVDIDLSQNVGDLDIIFGRRGIFTEFDIEFKERQKIILFKK